MNRTTRTRRRDGVKCPAVPCGKEEWHSPCFSDGEAHRMRLALDARRLDPRLRRGARTNGDESPTSFFVGAETSRAALLICWDG
jgi:hypothetical protein